MMNEAKLVHGRITAIKLHLTELIYFSVGLRRKTESYTCMLHFGKLLPVFVRKSILTVCLLQGKL